MSRSFADGYRWGEDDVHAVIEQLIMGVAIMHKERIAHRDLKPEVCFPARQCSAPCSIQLATSIPYTNYPYNLERISLATRPRPTDPPCENWRFRYLKTDPCQQQPDIPQYDRRNMLVHGPRDRWGRRTSELLTESRRVVVGLYSVQSGDRKTPFQE